MKYYLLFITLFIVTICKAELKVKIYYEQIDNGYNIYADNSEFCPVSIKLDFSTTNLDVDGGNNNIYVIEALTNKQLLTTLKVSKKGKGYKFTYNYLTNLGNHNEDSYDEDYPYYLPFKTSNTFKVHQGYNGAFSHKNENALDFTMPIGTEIVAIREGIVIEVVENNTKGCSEERCKKYNNFITIYHPDGTFANYSHLKQNGSKVKIGQKVVKGQLIGYSGNVGWSTGPHLHLEVYKQKITDRQTLKTKFKIEDGNRIEFLIEKNEYARNY